MVSRHCVLAGIGYVHVLYRHKVALHRYAFLSLVHMHNIHPGANIHLGCKFAPGVYFGHINGVL